MLEQSRGPLVYALMFRKNVLLYPVNPKQLARYRESYPGGGKDDPNRSTEPEEGCPTGQSTWSKLKQLFR